MIRTLVSSREEVVRNITSTTSMLLARVRSAATSKRFVVAALAFAAALGCNTADAQTWTGASLDDASGKEVFLLNVGTNKFVGQGGRWGTQAVIGTVGESFTLTKETSNTYYRLQTKTEGTKYLTLANGTNTQADDAGKFYVDWNEGKSDERLYFTAVDGQENTYTIYVVPSSNTSTLGTKAYLVNNNGAIGTSSTAPTDESGYWMLVPETEREEYFTKADIAGASAVPATFLIKDPGFYRQSGDVSNWYTDKTSVNYVSSGGLVNKDDTQRLPACAYASEDNPVKKYVHTYTYTKNSNTYTTTITNFIDGDSMKTISPKVNAEYTSKKYANFSYTSTEESSYTEGYTFYVGNGYADADDFDAFTGEVNTTKRQMEYGAEWTGNIHGSNAHVYQFLNPLRKGWYKISCNGFTTTEGAATLVAFTSSGITGTDEAKKNHYYDEDVLTYIAERPTTYVEASQTINTTENTNYNHEVWIYAGEVTKDDNTYIDNICFGVRMVSGGDNGWACFDDFRVDYYGDAQVELVLDENQTSVDYINAQRKYTDASGTENENYDGQRNLYLNRTMNANKWNTLVLPVDLTVGQVMKAFGTNVRISELKGATDEDRPGTIIFEAIGVSRDNETKTAIEAGKLYLVKPSSTDEYKESTAKTIPGTESTISKYYTIPQVTFCPGKDIEATVYGTEGDETYESKTKVQFVGTYVKLGDENKIPENSYVLNGNNEGGTVGLWYYRTVKTASKGFRGWLQTVSGQTSEGIEVEINGVVEKISGNTNGIDTIDADVKTIGGNVYNLNGQLVRRNAASLDGLAHGVYVVNGKKVVVK